MTCVYPYDIAAHAPNCGGRVPVDTTPGPVPVYRALKNPHQPNSTTELPGPPGANDFSTAAAVRSRLSPSQWHQETSSTCTTWTSISRRVLQRRNLYGPPSDHGNRPLRHDREVNLLDLHNRDIGHRVQQLWNVHGHTNSWTMEPASAPRRGSEPARPVNRDVDHHVKQLGNPRSDELSGPWDKLCATTGV